MESWFTMAKYCVKKEIYTLLTAMLQDHHVGRLMIPSFHYFEQVVFVVLKNLVRAGGKFKGYQPIFRVIKPVLTRTLHIR